VNVEVNRTTDPGVVVATPEVFTIVRTATSTVTEHRASVLPAAQLLPPVAEVRVLDKMSFPVSGWFTVTENVIVAVAPTARFPVQLRAGLA
jgi:hypothetical protein